MDQNKHNLGIEDSFFTTNQISKSYTLKFLKKQIKDSKIEKILDFTVEDWITDKHAIIDKIQKNFGKKQIIIRSSALGEDSISQSLAGNYESVLNVDVTLKSQIQKGVKTVIESYSKKGNSNNNNLILIQTQTKNIKLSGVIFSRTADLGSPYYVINYEESGLTDSVTKGLVNNSIQILRQTKLSTLPPHWSLLLKSIKEIEKILNSTSLDIEFGITNSNKVVIFQVRPITTIKDKPSLDNDVYKTVLECKKKIYFYKK